MRHYDITASLIVPLDVALFGAVASVAVLLVMVIAG